MGLFCLCSCVIQDVYFFHGIQLIRIVLSMFLCYPQDVDYFSGSTDKWDCFVYAPVLSQMLTIFSGFPVKWDCFVYVPVISWMLTIFLGLQSSGIVWIVSSIYVPVISRMLTIFLGLQLSGMVLSMFLCYPGC